MDQSILVIDDNEKLCRSLSMNFRHLGYSINSGINSAQAHDLLKSGTYDVMLLDIALGDENGLDLLDEIKSKHPQLPVIMITGFGSIKTAVEAIKKGAYDFIQKPLEFNKLLVIVENAIKMNKLRQENKNLKKKIYQMTPKIITSNKNMIDICHKAEKLAETSFPLLIQGESGTGKEGMAEFIHNRSDRNCRELIKINCAAFPENLLDNELFGHEKGAYTGAYNQFRGVFEKASGSSLLLDEIGDMSLPTQAKILRTLQNHEIRRIGSESTIKVDVRFIASSNKNLKELIKKDLFREDLYYRLSTATIFLPPLNERKDDIPLLVQSFLDDFYNDNPKKALCCSDEFLQTLMDYSWPGNIRELKNTINYAAAICTGTHISLEDLPPSFLDVEPVQHSHDLLKSSEKNLIMKTLQKTGNNKKKTAEILKISRKTLYNKMERYEIQR